MGALVVVVLWLGINAIISYFEDKKQQKITVDKKKTVIKTTPKNYNFDLFSDCSELSVSCKKSA